MSEYSELFKFATIQNVRKADPLYMEDFINCKFHKEEDYEAEYSKIFSEQIEESSSTFVTSIYGIIYLPYNVEDIEEKENINRKTDIYILECLKKNIKNWLYVSVFKNKSDKKYNYIFVIKNEVSFDKEFKIYQLTKAIKLALESNCTCMKINFKFPKNPEKLFIKLTKNAKFKPFISYSKQKNRIPKYALEYEEKFHII
jgi:hypothetical protein